MRLRGYIKEGGRISLTCCDSVTDVSIGEISLYDNLDKEFGLDPSADFDGIDQNTPSVGVSYLILDEDPGDGSFEDIIGEWITKRLYSEYVSGCYSEMTCGHGGYDYFINGGHNIFKEILSHDGKYILLDVKDNRELLIDEILR